MVSGQQRNSSLIFDKKRIKRDYFLHIFEVIFNIGLCKNKLNVKMAFVVCELFRPSSNVWDIFVYSILDYRIA